MIKKLILTKNKDIIKQISEMELPIFNDVNWDTKEKIEFQFDKFNIIYTNGVNKLGKSIILNAIQYFFHFNSKSSSLIRRNNKIIENATTSEHYEFYGGKLIFNYDVTLVFEDVKLTRKIEFDKSKKQFISGDYYYDSSKKINNEELKKILFDIYKSWPREVGIKKEVKVNILNKNGKLAKNIKVGNFNDSAYLITAGDEKLKPDYFLTNFEYNQSNDEINSMFFSPIKGNEKMRISPLHQKSILASILCDGQRFISKKIKKKILSEIRLAIENKNASESEINNYKILSKRKDNGVNVFDRIDSVKHSMNSIDDEISKWNLELQLLRANYNDAFLKLNPEYKIIIQSIEEKYTELNNLIENNSLATSNELLLSQIDYDKLIEKSEEEDGINKELLLSKLNSLKEVEYQIANEFVSNKSLDRSFEIATESVIEKGADAIERRLEILSEFTELNKKCENDIPYLMIDNVVDQKDREWKNIVNPIDEISNSNFFNQIFLTHSNKDFSTKIKEKEYLKSFREIYINEHIFIGGFNIDRFNHFIQNDALSKVNFMTSINIKDEIINGDNVGKVLLDVIEKLKPDSICDIDSINTKYDFEYIILTRSEIDMINSKDNYEWIMDKAITVEDFIWNILYKIEI